MNTKIQLFYKGKPVDQDFIEKFISQNSSNRTSSIRSNSSGSKYLYPSTSSADSDHENNLDLIDIDEENQYGKYVVSADDAKGMLDTCGIAIIPKLLSEAELFVMNDGMWTVLEHITSNFDKPINRNDKSSWKEIYRLLPLHGMLIQHWQLGHAQYVWDIRQNPKVVDVFCSIWGVTREELIVSFDGVAIGLPHEVTNRGKFNESKPGWLHTDQNFKSGSGFECIQSWVTGYDVDEGDATLVILEGSHKYHGDFAKKFGFENHANDWLKFEPEHIKFYKDKGCKYQSIRCPAGSMVLWDSRTVHAGREPLKVRANPHIRNVVYVCYTPRSLAPKKIQEKRKKIFEEKRLTSHWPHKATLFAKTPRLYPGMIKPNVVDVEDPVLTDLGKLLI